MRYRDCASCLSLLWVLPQFPTPLFLYPPPFWIQLVPCLPLRPILSLLWNIYIPILYGLPLFCFVLMASLSLMVWSATFIFDGVPLFYGWCTWFDGVPPVLWPLLILPLQYRRAVLQPSMRHQRSFSAFGFGAAEGSTIGSVSSMSKQSRRGSQINVNVAPTGPVAATFDDQPEIRKYKKRFGSDILCAALWGKKNDAYFISASFQSCLY